MRRLFFLLVGILVVIPSFVSASFTANSNITISNITLDSGTTSLIIFSGSTSSDMSVNSGQLSITNPGIFKVGANTTAVKSFKVKKSGLVVVCSNNTTPGTSYITLPTEAAVYIVEPVATVCSTEIVIPSCSAVTYGEWGACSAGTQVRSVATRTPTSCTLTTSQTALLSRTCSITPTPTPPVIEVIPTPASQLESRAIKNVALYNRLKGNILLKTEDLGKAYYVHPSSKNIYYLGRPHDAFVIMRDQGVGITNNNLKKITIGVEQMSGADQDGDALSDLFEDAIGTNKNKVDSDDDGHSDRTELLGNYNPLGAGKLSVDTNFMKAQRGRILLQVEGKGEAWYINPKDNKRYFLGRPSDAFYIMRNVGMGISNTDFNSL